MKVLYDISTLAHISNANVKPAGIFRHVENIALALSKNENVDLYFSSKPGQVKNSSKYLSNNKDLDQDKFKLSNSPLSDSIGSVFFSYGSSRFKNNYEDSVSTVILDKIIDQYDSESIAAQHFDIHHINWRGVERMPCSRGKKRNIDFVTIFDLIAIKNPEYFGLQGKNESLYIYLDNLMRSIQPEQHISVSTNAVKNDICTLYPHIKEDQIHVNYLGVSEKFRQCNDISLIERVKEKYNIINCERYIICVNTLEPRKNMKTVIKAFELLVKQEKIKSINLVLVGSKGWLYDDILSLIKKDNDITERIHLAGYVDDDDLPILLSGAEVFCYPSLDEGFGLPPLEAMKCGTPVISSNIPALKEVVNESGILVDPIDTESLSQSILKVISDKKLRRSLSKKALLRSKLFSWENCALSTYHSYKRACSY